MISVAMCTYNGSRYIDDQLSSIRNQTRMPDELVVCDDGSCDETVAKLRGFARNAPFPVRIFVNDMNMGSTRNFEKAIALCEGDLIALSDQDDIWVGTRLQRTEDVFAQDQSVGLIFGDADIIHTDSTSSGLRLWSTAGHFGRLQRFQFQHAKATQALLNHSVVTGATMAFRSVFREVVLPIPDIWVHDGWVALVISFFSNIAALNEPLIRYREHPNQQFGPSVEMTFSQQLAAAKTFPRWQYERELRKYEAAYDRLGPHAKTERQKRALRCISSKNVHLSSRAQMPEGIIKRAPVVLKELVTMRYMRFSRGLMSAAKDLLLA